MTDPVEKSVFLWVGNWPAIDFVNTAIVAGGRAVDLLGDGEALRTWLREAGLPAPQIETAAQAHRLTLPYRALLRESLEALAAAVPLPSAAIAETNLLLTQGPPVPQLTGQTGNFSLVSRPAAATPGAVLAPVALSMAKLLTEADPRRVRKCRNPACVLWFYDTSKSGTRAWCSLELCGNKLRMAASRRKRAG